VVKFLGAFSKNPHLIPKNSNVPDAKRFGVAWSGLLVLPNEGSSRDDGAKFGEAEVTWAVRLRSADDEERWAVFFEGYPERVTPEGERGMTYSPQ
jgi:hypothetical protein